MAGFAANCSWRRALTDEWRHYDPPCLVRLRRPEVQLPAHVGEGFADLEAGPNKVAPAAAEGARLAPAEATVCSRFSQARIRAT